MPDQPGFLSSRSSLLSARAPEGALRHSRARGQASTSRAAALLLACSVSACGDDDTGKPQLRADAGDADSGATDASAHADAVEDQPEPLPEPDWDAAVSPSGPPVGYAYAEKKGTFTLKEPASLAAAFNTLASDTQDVRLFYNGIESGDAGIEVDYGAVFVDDEGASYQYPDKVDTFQIAPSVGGALTFVSRPFDYHLYAWVPKPGRQDVGNPLELLSTQATWVAKFSPDFASIEEGSLNAAVLRSSAETAPFEIDALSCFAVCSNVSACAGGIATLSDLLDCNDAKQNVDTNGDGTKDAYRLRIEFSSERVPLQ